jgi:hypothetical protein
LENVKDTKMYRLAVEKKRQPEMLPYRCRQAYTVDRQQNRQKADRLKFME